MKKVLLHFLNEENGIHSVQQDEVPEILVFTSIDIILKSVCLSVRL